MNVCIYFLECPLDKPSLAFFCHSVLCISEEASPPLNMEIVIGSEVRCALLHFEERGIFTKTLGFAPVLKDGDNVQCCVWRHDCRKTCSSQQNINMTGRLC